MKFVTIVHPNVKGKGSCSEEAFEKHWKAKGWKVEGEAKMPEPKKAPEQTKLPTD